MKFTSLIGNPQKCYFGIFEGRTEVAAIENSLARNFYMPNQFTFSDLRELFAKANEEKPGDRLARIAVGSERERIAAKVHARRLSLDEIVRTF
jgi:hypothetical protein